MNYSKVNIIISVIVILLSNKAYALETTAYGKITGYETRDWGLHVQTNFAAGSSLGCPVLPGSSYMYDLRIDTQGLNYNAVVSSIMSAFMAGKDVSFHLYECIPGNARPIIGHVRVR